MDRFQGGKVFGFEGYELSVWKKDLHIYIYINTLTYPTVLLLRWYIGVMHRWIATVMTALLLLRTRLRCIAPCWCVRDWCELQGAGRSRKQKTDMGVSSSTVQPHSQSWPKSHEHLLPGVHRGGRGFQWSDDFTVWNHPSDHWKPRPPRWFHSYSNRKDAVATALSEHSIHFDSAFWREGKQTQVFAKLCPWVIDVGVIPASLVWRTFSHTRYHATSVFDAKICQILLLALLSDFDWSRCVRKHSNAQDWKT